MKSFASLCYLLAGLFTLCACIFLCLVPTGSFDANPTRDNMLAGAAFVLLLLLSVILLAVAKDQTEPLKRSALHMLGIVALLVLGIVQTSCGDARLHAALTSDNCLVQLDALDMPQHVHKGQQVLAYQVGRVYLPYHLPLTTLNHNITHHHLQVLTVLE